MKRSDLHPFVERLMELAEKEKLLHSEEADAVGEGESA